MPEMLNVVVMMVCDRCEEEFEILIPVYCYLGETHMQCEDCAMVTQAEAG